MDYMDYGLLWCYFLGVVDGMGVAICGLTQ